MAVCELAGSPLTEPEPATADAVPHGPLTTPGLAAGWFVVAVLARAPLVARIEGVLDHDQSVVGLMALDVAAGRRWPIFFDGQRYMGAVEAYAAAVCVRLGGHSPAVVAVAPLLFFGLFVAAQFAVWSRWRGRATGHLAAALTVLSAPMLTLWGVVPRGGYVEFLGWALATFAAYRRVTRPGRPALRPRAQFGWGFWLGLGYFLNPFSIGVYVTLAIDWALGRHGADLRAERRIRARWLDAPAAPVVWALMGSGCVALTAAFLHADPLRAGGEVYVPLCGLVRRPWASAVGALGVLAVVGGVAWWSRGPARLYRRMAANPWCLPGLMLAGSPFVANALMSRLNSRPMPPSLPMWVVAPWRAGRNLRDGLRAVGPLLGCEPRGAETVLSGSGYAPPGATWPAVESLLTAVSPLVVVLVVGLLAVAVWGERSAWSRLFALRGRGLTPPPVLLGGYLAVSVGLYLLQASSPDASSVRYLVPVWVALPGLLATALGASPARSRCLAMAALVVPWGVAQAALWSDLGRDAAPGPLAEALRRRGVAVVVAPTPLAVVVANLTQGAVGGVEYQSCWPRLGDRYLGRLRPGSTITCLVDRGYPFPIPGVGCWAPDQDFGRHLRDLGVRHPGRVRLAWRLGAYDVWEVDRPLTEVLDWEPERATP